VGGRIGLGRGDQFAQNQSVNRRLAGLGFPALVAGVYDLSFLPLAHPPAVESPERLRLSGWSSRAQLRPGR